MVVLITEKKLEYFSSFYIEDARTHSAEMLDEYTNALERIFEEHQTDATRRTSMQLDAETAKMQREINKNLSIEQVNSKRTLGHKQDGLKGTLFVKLKDMLESFMEATDYQKLLESQISRAEEVTGNGPLIICLDPADEDKAHKLTLQHNADIRINEYSFSGGNRATIPSGNILIDNSFETELAETRADFRFELDTEAGGRIYGQNRFYL